MIFIAGLNNLKIITLIYLLITGGGNIASSATYSEDSLKTGDTLLVNTDSNYTNPDLKIETPKIKVIGHSWAYGTFHNYEKFFSDYGIIISEDTKVATSLQWTLDHLKSVEPGEYNAICIFTGINDYRNDVRYITEKFSKIFEEALSRSAVVFVFNIPDYAPASEKVNRINEWLNEVAKLNSNIIVIDIYTEMELQKKEGLKMAGNGLHPGNYQPVRNLFIYDVQKYYGIK